MSMPKYAMTYVVYWPEQGVLKVGRAWRLSRVREMQRSGGQVIVLARGTDGSWEREALRVLRRWFPQAFATSIEAEAILHLGKGWTECFRVQEHDVQFALDRCIEGFARGNDQGVNETENDQRERYAVARVPERPGRGEADGVRSLDTHRRDGQTRAGAGADSRGSVSGSSGDGDGRRAPADARGLRVPDDLSGRRQGVDRADAPSEGRRAWRTGRDPGAPARGHMESRGCGGRGRASESERAGAGGGRREGGGVGGGEERARGDATAAGKATPAGCSTDRMRRTPPGARASVRTMPHSAASARRVAGPKGVRGEAGALSRTDGGTTPRGSRR